MLSDCIYIGYTSRTLAQRLQEHAKQTGRGSKQLISRAIRKYGLDNFSIEELSCVDTKEEALGLEIAYITELQTDRYRWPDGNGYNLHEGGNVPPSQKGKTFSGRKRPGPHTEAHKAAIGRSVKGKFQSDEKRERCRLAATGKHHSDVSKSLIGSYRRGKTYDDIYGEQQGAAIRLKQSNTVTAYRARLPE